MKILLSEKSKEPMYQQIVNQIRGEIVNGVLKDGDKLPSIRHLANELSVSVITTKKSFEILEDLELIYPIPGKGYYVNSRDIGPLKESILLELNSRIKAIFSNYTKLGLSKSQIERVFNNVKGDFND